MSRKSYVDSVTDPHNPIIKLEIEGYVYSFSVQGFPPDSYEWLAGVLEGQMQDIHNRAVRKTWKKMRDGFKSLLGL